MSTHSLAEHLGSVQAWHAFHVSGSYVPGERHQTCLMIAYERWLNNRPLLMDEDPEYERIDRADVTLSRHGNPPSGPVYRRRVSS